MSEPMANHIVLGMAGHIDHGKTAIVKALTGTDTDRLKEEKERGMTTDLGFAFLSNDITIIDVPGHEKFVKTMVAGVNTVDIGLLVIAADDGVMPQTKEHLEILDLLNVSTGIIAINKTDLVEEEWLELVIDDVKSVIKGTVLEKAAVIPVSSLKNQGIDTLKDEIFRIAKFVRARQDKEIFRLPVDRVFSIKGFGTVVAGTVLSGRISPEDTVELLPRQIPLRVRGVQIHDKSATEGTVGYRVAINLGKIEKASIERGDVLAEPGFYTPTFILDASFQLLKSWKKDLKHRARVRVHMGTSEVIARILLLDKSVYTPGDKGFVQFHFEKPVIADSGDRYVVRSYSPLQTLGGGMVIDTHPSKHKQFQKSALEKLARLLEGDPNQIVLEHLNKTRYIPKSVEELYKEIGITKEELLKRLDVLEKNKQIKYVSKKKLIHSGNYDSLVKKIKNNIIDFHTQNPLQYAISAGKLRLFIGQPVDPGIFDDVLTNYRNDGTIIVDGDQIRLSGHTAQLSPKLQEYKEKIENTYLTKLFNPPKFEDILDEMGVKVKKILNYLVEAGVLVQIEKGIYFHAKAIKDAESIIVSFYTNQKEIASLDDMKNCFKDTSRRKLVSILEYFDRTGLTKRVENGRKLNR